MKKIPNFEILDMPENPEPKTLKIQVNWYDWDTIEKLMEKNQWDLEDVFYHIFTQWGRLERWLDKDDELDAIWDAICEEENARIREAQDAMAEAFNEEPCEWGSE